MSRRSAIIRQRLPRLWLISDARNDATIAQTLTRMPRASGFIFRHYHLPPHQRRAWFIKLARLARARAICVILAGSPTQAAAWGADGAYGAPRSMAQRLPTPRAPYRLVTAHSLHELAAANRLRADAVLLSPVFATRSHPAAAPLGPVRFRLIAARACLPVIALGGINPHMAYRIRWARWAAIDSFAKIGWLDKASLGPVDK